MQIMAHTVTVREQFRALRHERQGGQDRLADILDSIGKFVVNRAAREQRIARARRDAMEAFYAGEQRLTDAAKTCMSAVLDHDIAAFLSLHIIEAICQDIAEGVPYGEVDPSAEDAETETDKIIQWVEQFKRDRAAGRSDAGRVTDGSGPDGASRTGRIHPGAGGHAGGSPGLAAGGDGPGTHLA